MEKLVYLAFLKDNGNSEGFTVRIPALEGCISFGNSIPDALQMACDAAAGWILDELEDNKPIPFSDMKLKPDKNEFQTFIVIDMDAYIEKYGNKAVRKNTTIPAFLNTFGDRHNINFSQVLTDALMSMYLKENVNGDGSV